MIRRLADVDETEMYSVFNMGIGFCAVVAAADADRAISILSSEGKLAHRIGYAVVDPGRHVRLLDQGLVGQGKHFRRIWTIQVADNSEAIRTLEGLRGHSEHLPERGFASAEFQQWHAVRLRSPRDLFGEDDVLVQDFQKLQFEWPPEPLEFSRAFEALTEMEFPFEVTQEERFRKALVQAREIFTAAIVILRTKK
jgi:AIR synthase related protein